MTKMEIIVSVICAVIVVIAWFFIAKAVKNHHKHKEKATRLASYRQHPRTEAAVTAYIDELRELLRKQQENADTQKEFLDAHVIVCGTKKVIRHFADFQKENLVYPKDEDVADITTVIAEMIKARIESEIPPEPMKKLKKKEEAPKYHLHNLLLYPKHQPNFHTCTCTYRIRNERFIPRTPL